ncbi:FAD-dependent oxidoreductase [Paenibacillus profundus]|uniref:FAD-dependent oxidoreductase n=1 Tax=Paenibacillus profundus TaxID=1173085 RepID=A0ABS8YM63_9BACL|nr:MULTISPECIES: FAD-dependent oxidoreductase [Paenibacillus]MCE5172274.1 FAD-dependent oxidoreductase [Paenibacillus profundus]
MNRVDVAIIGGGPAGAATAIFCAESGLSVAIIESASFPRDRPGESLHPGIEPLLKRLGVDGKIREANFVRHEGHWTKWDADWCFVPFGADDTGPWRGFQAWRADFDAIMIQRAAELGVQMYQPCRAIRPIVERKRVSGLVTSEGELRSSWVVDAAGGHHWLARKLGLPIKKYSPRLIVRYGYVTGQCPTRDHAPVMESDSRGWTWTAKVRPNVYQWTRLDLVQDCASEQVAIPKEYEGMSVLGRIKGVDVTWRKVKKPAGPGYWLVGDAAFILDPASSHGVLKAIMSGMMTAHHITGIATGSFDEKTAFRAYQHWLGDWFHHDRDRLEEFYRLLPCYSN